MNNINLARKLRPKIFEEIIGQDLSIRMLKNSLYLNKFFPVYLFSGQRGCGKTSTARVFGSAINCKKLNSFQKDAHTNRIPCLECESCKSMLRSSHPDFIEMDAASHTGVDSVRQIIESCAYLPLSGYKKIYLIDEAHMLSRAAFNAFLKILEEPPTSTIFILATTEIQKIPETVRSRCFQVIFNRIQNKFLLEYMKKICVDEKINAEDKALSLLVNENDGSARDAINALEQVRFSGKKVTSELVLKSLGKISDKELYELMKFIIDQNPRGLLEQLNKIDFESLSAQSLWNMTVEFFRSLLWLKYGVSGERVNSLENLAKKCSINRVHALLQILWSQEPLFLQTPQKHLFLEAALLNMSLQVNIADLQNLVNSHKSESQLVESKLAKPQLAEPNPTKPQTKHINEFRKLYERPTPVNTSNKEKWPKANLLKKTFQGTTFRDKTEDQK
jgi:DNA polymerase-3 subunit gamma/tau